MAETLPTAPPIVEIGSTPIYFKAAQPITVDGATQTVDNITLKPMRFDPNQPKGFDNAVILLKDPNPRNTAHYKPIGNVGPSEQVNWDNVYGLLVTDDRGRFILKNDELTLVKPGTEQSPAPSPEPTAPTPEPAPAPVNPEPAPSAPAALTELEKRATEPPKSISLIGLDVDQSIQARAAKDMQKQGETKNIITKIWKGNVAHELLQEHAYQFRKKQVDAAHQMLSDETFATIESRAKTKYEAAMAQKTGLGRAWTNFTDLLGRNLGIETSLEKFAIAESGEMYANNELANIDQYEKGIEAVRVRYEHDFQDADGVIRHELGEKLDIFRSGDARHKAITDGIKDIVHKYADGTLATKQDVERAMAQFARNQKIGADPKTAQEAQLYASSLFDIAKNAKDRLNSGVAMADIDAQLDAMEVRVGRAQMGEATQFESSTTQKVVEWMASKNLIGTLIANEGTAGTIAALTLSLGYLPRSIASRGARLAGGMLGGGAVAGAIAGLKENARLKAEYFTYMRERESGGGLPQAGDKRREWMAAREIKQTTVAELTGRIASVAYENGRLKDLSGEDLKKTLAYLSDAKAKRALSARGKENISLIQWGAAVDVGRTNLDLSIDKLERDLVAKFGTDTRPEFAGQNITQYTKLLTDTQTAILRDGTAVPSALATALGEVSDKAPSVIKYRKKFVLWGEQQNKGEVKGLDDAWAEIKTQIRYEAVRRGVDSAVIGTTIGTALTEIGLGYENLFNHGANNASALLGGLEQTFNIDTHVPTHIMDLPVPHYTDAQGIDHALQVQLPDHTQLVPHGNEGAYWLTNDKGDILVHGIHIDPHTGQIVDAHALNEVTEVTKQGFHFENEALSNGVGPEGSTGGTFDVSVKEMGPGGFSGWMLDTLHAKSADVTHDVPATNLHKHLFKFYELNVTHNSNVDIEQIPEYHRVIHYVTDPVTKEQIISYKEMPDNMWFRNLPNVFNTEGQIHMGHVMDDAISLHDKVVADGHFTDANMPNWHVMMEDMEAADPENGHLYALAWKIGVVDQPPTQAEFDELMSLLGGNGSGPIYMGVIEQTTNTAAFAGDIFTEFPAVVPLPREGMKQGSKPVAQPAPPFSMEPPTLPSGAYYGEESLQSLRNWLKQYPDKLHTYNRTIAAGNDQWRNERGEIIQRDVVRERSEIQKYLESIRATDSEYYAKLESFAGQNTLTPMTNENRVSVNVPAWMEGKTIYNVLDQYVNQVDKSGQKLNPNLFEINIIVNRKTGTAPDNSVAEIQRFIDTKKAAGENYHINFVDVEFDPPFNNVGHARRVLTDLNMMRSLQRTNQQNALYIESEDADLLHIDPRTVINIMEKLDQNPYLDGVRGIQDRYPEVMMKNDYLFLQRRLWDMTELLLRKDKFRPDENTKWNFTWNRVITGGWNTAYTAESYAIIGGYDSRQTKGEDMTIGEKITMVRGDGTMPNLDVIGRVPTRSDSSPRRFMNEILTGKGAYSDAFENEDINEFIRTASLEQMLDRINPIARISPDNSQRFTDLFSGHLGAIRELTPNEAEARKTFDSLMMHIGFKKEDYTFDGAGNLQVTSLENVKNALEDYRQRHPTTRKPGERIKYTSTP